MLENNINCIGLSLTRKVKSVLEEKGIESQTFAQLFYQNPTEPYNEYIRRVRNNIRNKYVIVDELGMVTRTYIEKLYEIWKKEKFPVILIGDYRQLPPPETNGCRNNFELSILKEMCDYNLILLKHPYRCDEIIDEISNQIHDKGIAENKFSPIKEVLEYNLAYTNEMVAKINEKCFNEFKPETLDGLGLFKNCRIMFYDNWNGLSMQNEKYEINNSDTFRYYGFDCEFVYLKDDINDDIVKVVTKDFIKMFKKKIKLGYCSTIHKYQGSTISVPFNIYEVNKFDRKLCYTALTRATTYKNIHIDSWIEKFRKTIIDYEIIDITNKNTNHIYVLTHQKENKLNIYYVGQTNDSRERLKQHQANLDNGDCHYPVYQYMRENNITEIEMKIVRSCNKDEVDDLEKLYIKQYQKAGIKLYNYQLNCSPEEKYTMKESKNPQLIVNLKGSIYIGENYVRFRYTQDRKQKEIKRVYKSEEQKKILEEKIKNIQYHYSIYGVLPNDI
jgi:hypothetical protein